MVQWLRCLIRKILQAAQQLSLCVATTEPTPRRLCSATREATSRRIPPPQLEMHGWRVPLHQKSRQGNGCCCSLCLQSCYYHPPTQRRKPGPLKTGFPVFIAPAATKTQHNTFKKKKLALKEIPRYLIPNFKSASTHPTHDRAETISYIPRARAKPCSEV